MIKNGELTLDDVLKDDVFVKLNNKIIEWKQSMEGYKTAKLWLQYMEMVQILRDFIRSARNGDWALYLHSLQEMLPFLASSGHNYTKSLVLFLAKMEKLSETHPEIHTKFNEGYFVVRIS